MRVICNLNDESDPITDIITYVNDETKAKTVLKPDQLVTQLTDLFKQCYSDESQNDDVRNEFNSYLAGLMRKFRTYFVMDVDTNPKSKEYKQYVVIAAMVFEVRFYIA